MKTIEQTYNELCTQASDINEHLPTLYNLAKECNTILELGVRSVVSTYAFAHARPKKIYFVDIVRHPNVDIFIQQCDREGIDVEFINKSSLSPETAKQVDLIFIDTLHTYYQLKKELRLHGNNSNKYIAFHDTIHNGHRDENDPYITPEDYNLPKGLVPAIAEFLKENSHWKELKTYTNNNGLTVLINSTYKK